VLPGIRTGTVVRIRPGAPPALETTRAAGYATRVPA